MSRKDGYRLRVEKYRILFDVSEHSIIVYDIDVRGQIYKKEGDIMTAIRQEVLNYINDIPDNKLEALKPILTLLLDDTIVVESDLTSEEKEIIRNGRDEYKKGDFISLDSI